MAPNYIEIYFKARKDSLIREAGVTFLRYFSTAGVNGHNDVADAFRHTFISGKVASEYGEGFARTLGNLIEAEHINFVPGEPAFTDGFGNLNPGGPKEFYMDQWNNAVGRGLAKIAVNDDHLARLTAAAARTGTLITSLDDPRVSPREAEGFGLPTFGLSEEAKADAALENFKSSVHTTEDGRVFLGDAEDDFVSEVKPLDAPDNFCFVAGTLVDMADGTQKPIEQIKIGDEVMAFDPYLDEGRGGLRASKVTQTHATPNRMVIDFHGTRVTPGHLFLCGDGPDAGGYSMLMDILRADGAVVRADGTQVRAATNCPLSSKGDRMLVVGYFLDSEDYVARNGEVRIARLRAGTRLLSDDGKDWSFAEAMEEQGFELFDDGSVAQPGEKPHPFYYFGPPPRPEDYILKKSGITLAELYTEDATLGEAGGISLPPVPRGNPAMHASAGVLQAQGNRRDRRRQKAVQRKRNGETFH